MYRIALLSDASGEQTPIPALSVLSHRVEALPLTTSPKRMDSSHHDVIMIDARQKLIEARNTAQAFKAAEITAPIMMVLTEGGMAAVSSAWMVDDIVLDQSSPSELDARLRLIVSSADSSSDLDGVSQTVRVGSLMIDAQAYSAYLNGTALNLTFKEFELLKFMAQYPGRVFTRAQLLSEVWGYDAYYGGTRTVDVHVRRLRSKLGTEYEQMISTVRNVGYSFNTQR